ncbi:hypothetical protein GCM10009677_24790 [Sphaerisporangium rubeum]|uniref:Phosphatidylserine/phosphatidylglycerophosphate/ cardiolipin synthase-like enzyme n=1 Tax=Sphaerisporangium rubeum TaxID=321317 RepID=A0A7X0I9Y4_9ACTN|nr:DISARM system phospholipase D-like protein DrmC [Sphaerisporangium rubeum]MBB6471190.1 phosphatidylserine/phosphatidylglycerophosphate/cardiolipin synthase-like enzyme [Sphaerisporangium rubeum]
MTGHLSQTIAALATDLPLSHLKAWVTLLRTAETPDGVLPRLIESRPSASPQAIRLVDAWRRHAPEVSGSGVALALEAATRVHVTESARRPSVVVSGPTTEAVPVRLTVSAVTEIVRAAKESLLVVSYAAYGVHEVAEELAAAADRGVRVDLVLETAAEEGGTLRGPSSADAFRLLTGKATFWTWPPARRPQGAALHAKLLAADTTTVLLGSANLTTRALMSNIEIGVILRDPATVSRIVTHLRALMRPDVGLLVATDRPPFSR